MSKRKLKKPVKNFLTWTARLFCLVVLFGIGLTIYGLVEPQDDGTTTISADYQLVKESSRSTYIRRISDQEIVVPSIVISYSTCDDFIAARQTKVPESTDNKPDFTTFTYWLIDTDSNTVQSELATEDFTAACTENNLSFEEWLGA